MTHRKLAVISKYIRVGDENTHADNSIGQLDLTSTTSIEPYPLVSRVDPGRPRLWLNSVHLFEVHFHYDCCCCSSSSALQLCPTTKSSSVRTIQCECFISPSAAGLVSQSTSDGNERRTRRTTTVVGLC